MTKTWLVLPLRTWLALSHLGILLLPIAVVLLTGALALDLRRQTQSDVEHQATLLAGLIERELNRGESLDGAALTTGLEPLLQDMRGRTLAGFQVVDAGGVVTASSGNNRGQDRSDHTEVQAALAGTPSTAVKPRARGNQRYNPRTKSRSADVRVFATEPLHHQGAVVGAVIVSRTPREEVQALYHMAPNLWLGALLAILLTAGLGLAAGYLFSRSLRRMAQISERIADGSVASTALLARPERSHVRETRDLALAVSEMATRLQERMGYISEFAGNVSHEFKTPLSTLRGTIELLGDDSDMPAEQRARFLHNASSEVDRLGRLVHGLLDLARAEEAIGHAPLDLDEVLTGIAGRYPDVQLTGSAGRVVGNAEQLDTAISNLLQNAMRYGGQGVSVQLIASRTGAMCTVQVIDDGPGIGPANLPRVTERFFTTDRAGGGTGLGLALVQAVCRAHRGTLHVASERGRTTLTVRIPAA